MFNQSYITVSFDTPTLSIISITLRNKIHCFLPTSMRYVTIEWSLKPRHIKGYNSEKDNYQPVSKLLNLTKNFKRCTYNQIDQFFDKLLSKHQHGFRQGRSAQHCLIVLFEKWREIVQQGLVFGALITELSQCFT